MAEAHINGIESFWSFAKRRLQKFNGVPVATFHLHLKESDVPDFGRPDQIMLPALSQSLIEIEPAGL